MTARAITFSLEIGSGGFEIAHAVADALKYRYYDWEIVSEVASRVGASPDQVASLAERIPTLAERVLQQLAFVGSSSPEAAWGEPSPDTLRAALQTQSLEHYRQLIEHVVKELADQGEAVIVGHAGQVTLGDSGGVLKVLVHGSRPQREARLMQEQTIDAERAKSIATQLDKQRATFFKKVHGVDWLRASLYDICLNTDQVSLETAAAWIVEAAQAIQSMAPEPPRKEDVATSA